MTCLTFCRTFVVLLAISGVTAAGDPPPTVMHYLGQRAHRMVAALPAMPSERAAWEKRRAVVREDLTRLLGLPPREPMRAKVLATRDEGELLVEDVAFLWAERAYVSGNVVRPKGAAGTLPALVVPPGWLGELKYEYYKSFVDHMARRGYVVLFIDDPHVAKRVAPCAGLYGAAASIGTQVMGIQVFDTLRGLDYMLTRSDVDPGRIGVAGLCQGSEQTWLAAALEERFQVAVPVCGTTTYAEWVDMPAATGVHLSDPSPYIEGVLDKTDWHEIAACIAPRPVYIASNSGDNWWPPAGYDKVVSTLDAAFRLYGKPERFRHLRDLRSHSMTPYIPELAPWIDQHLKALPASPAAAPLPCAAPGEMDFSMLRYAQRQTVKQAAALPADFASRQAWEDYRESMVQWLRKACDKQCWLVREARTLSQETSAGLRTEWVHALRSEGFDIPLLLIGRPPITGEKRPAVILSHDGTSCAGDKPVMDFARSLAEDGYLVAIPEHATPNKAGRRAVDNVISLYGAGDATGLPPMAMRVRDDSAAVTCLFRRKDVRDVAVVGLGVGGVDVAITAAMDDRLRAVAVVGPVTVRDWAEQTAPQMNVFDRVLPYLPGILTTTDLEYIYSAAAPRPLLLVDDPQRADWPAAACDRVKKLAKRIYSLCGEPSALSVQRRQSPEGVEEVRQWLRTVASAPTAGDAQAKPAGRTFHARDFGAVADGKTDAGIGLRAAIAAAIVASASGPGGVQISGLSATLAPKSPQVIDRRASREKPR